MNDQAKIIGNEEGWRFCPACAGSLELKIPEGDDHLRKVCFACERIYYENPKLIAGTLPMVEGKVLLCKRAIEPRSGYWTLPAGFLENDESAEEGAARETWEEARAKVRIQRLHTVFSIPHVHQVYFLYLADVIDGVFEAGPESMECQLFSPEDIPWNEIAFKAIEFTLQRMDKLSEEGVHRGSFRGNDTDPWMQTDPQ